MARADAPSDTGARTRRRGDTVAADLLDAAAIEFAAHGFDGASTRRIAARAGAHQPQINYHFSSKEQLWRATVTRLFDQLAAEGVGDAPGSADDLEAATSAIRTFMRFSAAHPELNRIINQEATVASARLDWLVAAHLRPLFELLDAIWSRLRASGRGADLTTAEVWELTTSYGALHFANEPMHAALGIATGTGPAAADAHADSLLAIVLPPS